MVFKSKLVISFFLKVFRFQFDETKSKLAFKLNGNFLVWPALSPELNDISHCNPVDYTVLKYHLKKRYFSLFERKKTAENYRPARLR